MNRNQNAIYATVRDVTANRITREHAARILGVSVRTVHNYVKKFVEKGPDGLRDRRRGHFRKIATDQEFCILACKLDRPGSSARWVRDRLKLAVSVEAVRQVFLKHRLNRSNLGSESTLIRSSRRWEPF
jgi:transposase